LACRRVLLRTVARLGDALDLIGLEVAPEDVADAVVLARDRGVAAGEERDVASVG
jgi:hypothetical protein